MNEEVVKPEYTSIANVIKEAEEKKLLLPEFQRPFVWTVEQSKDLFDSLVRGIFIGTFVLAKPQFDLTCRPIDIRPRAGKGSRAKIDNHFFKSNQFEFLKTYVVLDGQQRITSLYRVLKGNDKVYFVFKDINDIPSPNEEINNIEQIIESLTVKPVGNALCIELSEVFACATWKDKEIRQKVFESKVAQYEFIKNDSELAERYFDLLLDLKRLFSDLINDKTMLSVFFLNMGIEKFCTFFERSNSKGTELSFIDIITAKIYKDFNLDKHVNEFKETNRAILFDNAMVEAFVRYFSFRKAGQVDRKTILISLDGIDFQNYWKETAAMYVKSYNFLKSQRLIFDNNWMPYKTMYIPILHFIYHIPHQDFSQVTPIQMKFFRFWFWGSLLNTRYGGGMVGSTNDIIVEDCRMLEYVASGQLPTKEFLKKFKFDFEKNDLLELTSKGAIFTGIMSIINYSGTGLKNLNNNNLVDFKNTINVHHIFPTKYLENSFEEEAFENEYSDSILNKMLIEKIPNLKFGDKSPSQYLVALNANLNIEDSLKSHNIPAPDKLITGYYNGKFEEFMDSRAQLFIETINTLVASIKAELLTLI
jgi:hypothetical protein